ncbi:DNA primase [Methylophilales phage MEP402]|nr:DNA primase [Methylophilales phage MEP402]
MNMTSKFIKLGPCPHCGSSDARAEYADNYYCFSCSKYESKTDTASLRERIKQRTQQSVQNVSSLLDTVKDIPQKGMQWLLKYNITPAEIKEYGISWNASRQLLVLLQDKGYWQARNFGFGNYKYASQGMKPLTIYGEGDTIIVVEDVLSAIKIARCRGEGYCATPLLGSSLSKQVLAQLTKQYESIYVWLDRDKAKQAIRIRNTIRQSGKTSKAIISKLDPKEYNKEEILQWLKN